MIDTTDHAAMIAEAKRRQQLRDRGARTFDETPPPKTAEEIARDESIAENEEQAYITRWLRANGFTVRSTSSVRRARIAKGFPDLFVTHNVRPIGFLWETKRQVGGALSEAQGIFGEDCLRCGVPWGAGDRYLLRRYLWETHGLAIELAEVGA